MPGTIGLIITAVQIAAKFEPVIAAVLGALIPALQQLHASHGDAAVLADIKRVFLDHGIKPSMVTNALQNAAPGPEGQSPAQI